MSKDIIYREDAIKAIEELRKEPHWLHDGDNYRVCGLSEAEDAVKCLPSVDRWIPCSKRLPNEDEIPYDGIERKGERTVSDRILAIDKNGFIRTGYFMNAMDAPRFGKRYEFGEHYQGDLTNWIVGVSCRRFDPIAWMPLPEPWKGADNEM